MSTALNADIEYVLNEVNNNVLYNTITQNVRTNFF